MPTKPALVGRDVALRSLSTTFSSDARLISIVGGPGIGKSAVATRFACSYEPVWIFDWCDVRDWNDACANVARTLGLLARSTDFEAALKTAIESNTPRMIVLDNVEQAVPAAISLITTLLLDHPELKIVVTSRRALELPSETVFELPPLSCDARQGSLSDAARMLARASFGPEKVWTDEERATLERIARAVDGVPLALATVAARLRTLPLSCAVRDLASPAAILASPVGSALGRHASVRAALAWSWDLLSDDEKLDLFGAATFASAFELDAARSVLTRPESIVARLVALREQHLLDMNMSEDGRQVTFRMSSVIRAFVRERGADLAGASDLVARHAHHFLLEAGKISIDWILGHDSTFDDARFADVLDAIDWYLARIEQSSSPDSYDVDLLLSAMVGFAAMAAEGAGGTIAIARLERAVQFAAAASRSAEAKLWLVSGALKRLEGDLAGALASFELAATDAPSPELRAIARLAQTAALARAGRTDEARQYLPLAESEEFPRLRAEALRIAAGISAVEGDVRDAEHLARIALRTQTAAEVTPRPSFEIMVCVLMAQNGRVPLARTELMAVRERVAASRHRRLVAMCDTNLGSMSFQQGEVEAAIKTYAAAYEAHARIGDGIEAGIALGCSAIAYFVKGDAAEASSRLERAILLLSRAGASERAQWYRSFLAVALAAQGNPLARERAQSLLPDAAPESGDARRIDLAARLLLAPSTERAELQRAAENILSDGRPEDSAFARRTLEAAISLAAEDALPRLRMSATGTCFEVDGRFVDLSHRPTLARIMRALNRTATEGPLSSADLIDAGWPGERIVRRAALSRLRVALCTLRKFGLRDNLFSSRHGHELRGRIEIVDEWLLKAS